MEPKQVILLRTDLRNKLGQKVRTGKLCAQVAHASMLWLCEVLQQHETYIYDAPGMSNFMSAAEYDWMFNKAFTKITLAVDSELELLKLVSAAKEAGLKAFYVTDNGRTEFAEPTITAAAIGPEYADKIDAITGHLKPY